MTFKSSKTKKKVTEKTSFPRPKSFRNGFQVFQTKKNHRKNKSSKTRKQTIANFANFAQKRQLEKRLQLENLLLTPNGPPTEP